MELKNQRSKGKEFDSLTNSDQLLRVSGILRRLCLNRLQADGYLSFHGFWTWLWHPSNFLCFKLLVIKLFDHLKKNLSGIVLASTSSTRQSWMWVEGGAKIYLQDFGSVYFTELQNLWSLPKHFRKILFCRSSKLFLVWLTPWRKSRKLGLMDFSSFTLSWSWHFRVLYNTLYVSHLTLCSNTLIIRRNYTETPKSILYSVIKHSFQHHP